MTTHAESMDHHAADAHAHAGHSGGGGGGHALRLMPFFLALLALTGAEVGLYEWWRHSYEVVDGVKVFGIPKFALVLLILVFTLPKAYIVLVYFMHIKFEKAIIVWLAVIPLMMTFLAVLPTLTDTATLKARKINHPSVIGIYPKPVHGEPKATKDNKGGDPSDPAKAKPKTADPEDDYK